SIFQAPNFASAIQPDRKSISKTPGTVSLVFFSRISPKKNLLFALDILAKNSFPGTIHLTVAGEIEDKTYWQSCLDRINSFPANIHFEYAGAVEHSLLLDWLQQFHFLFLPTFGENFGHAIFESFIAGKPVIISDKTPWQNLQQQKLGWEIPLSNEQGFVTALNSALNMNQDQYNELSEHCAVFADAYRNNNETRKLYIELFS
ncbi:MAG: glycosyltransferase, partial [Flavitalea sp.]